MLNVFEFCYINYCVGFLKHFSVGKINLLGQIMTKHTSGSIAFKIMGFDSNIIWWADLPAFAFDICMQRWRRRPGWPWQGQGASEVHKTQLVNSLADAPSTTQHSAVQCCASHQRTVGLGTTSCAKVKAASKVALMCQNFGWWKLIEKLSCTLPHESIQYAFGQ